MKKIIITIFLMTVTLIGAIEINVIENNGKIYKAKHNSFKIFQSGNRGSNTIIITKDGKLSIDDNEVQLPEKSKILVKEYYSQLLEIRNIALKIGKEGGEIGLSGAVLGLKAIIKLPLLFLGEDKYEEAIEHEAEKLEAKSEKLELKADELEKYVEQLEIIENKLTMKVPELRDIEWLQTTAIQKSEKI